MIATLDKTRQTRVLNTISILAGGALFLVLFLHFRPVSAPVVSTAKTYEAVVNIGSIAIPVIIADTKEEQEQGLSGTESLRVDSGLLFVFNVPGRHGFWMKDMNYALDLVWIDENLKIIAISKDITPQTYPTIFTPPEDVKYVLEVNAGFSTKNNITENQILTISTNLTF